jgi:peptidyl-prolyl cis-trans isomerase C
MAADQALAFIPDVAASYDGGVIRGDDIRDLMRPQLEAQLRSGVRLGTGQLVQWALALTATEMDHELAVRDATAAGLKPDLLGAREELAKRRQSMGEEVFAQTMAMQGVHEDVVVRKLAENNMINRWLAEQVRAETTIDEDTLRDHYKENKADYKMPDSRQLWHILIAKRPGMTKDREKLLRANAEDVLARLREGMSFQRLARSGSDCPSAPRGGDLGLVPEDRLNKDVRRAVSRLEFGEISDILESPAGYHIFLAGAEAPGRQLDFDEVRDQVARRLQSEAINGAMDRMKEAARAASHAAIHIQPATR